MHEPDLGERLILEQLQDQQKQLRRIDERLRHIEINLGILKAKAAFIGAIAGLLPSLLIWFFSRG
jgi:hypothetical protein|tara:strand:- start:160 stop:354 length:195 start_codon:yes stop_codon:yes gene_type:complete